jgi:Tol biopolymer transport system component
MKKHRGWLVALAALALVFSTSVAGAQERLLYSYQAAGSDHWVIYSMVPGAIDQGSQLIEYAGDAWCPRVSPDGTRVAFADKGSGAIYVSNLDGTAFASLNNPVGASSLEWSSDGSQIYFWGQNSPSGAHSFYSVPSSGGDTTTLFGGQSYWCWFYDGGFEVYSEGDQEYILFGANQTGQVAGKCDLLRLPVTTDPVGHTVVFDGLGDNYTPTRHATAGWIEFQADHDRRGSHAIYRLWPDGNTSQTAGLYAGSPSWNYDQTGGEARVYRLAYIHASSSTYGERAYQGTLFVMNEDGSHVAQITSGEAACPSWYTPVDER